MAADDGADPARTVRLLWRNTVDAESRRGPKKAQSVDEIVAIAIQIADREGISALSMRRIADVLDVGTMSLYTYVAGKSELIDAMVDAVNAEAVPAGGLAADATWRERLEEVGRANWRLFQRHAWLLEVSRTRSVLGPHTIAKYDAELQAIDGIGLTPVEMDAALNVVIAHAEGAARRVLEATHIERQTGMSDIEWWERVGPVLGQVVDPAKYPTATRIGAAVGEAHQAAAAPDHDFDFGLRRILDGIEVLVATRT
jgi:AcrR family transcriptional regulator